jgi:formylmethanofuran dehydrogenase subunit E
MPVNWDKKSFSLPARSADADPQDFGRRWDDTFPKAAKKLDETQKVEIFEVKRPSNGIQYPVACSKCGDMVSARDHHWVLGGKVQCTKCGPFGELEG